MATTFSSDLNLYPGIICFIILPGYNRATTQLMEKNMETCHTKCIAFDGFRCIAAGPLTDVALAVKKTSDAQPQSRILVFNAQTSEPIEIDCRGSVADVIGRIAASTSDELPVVEASPPAAATPAGPGRPRLGVVAREITLLPRHWEWLSSQPGGASVALRKLVEQAKRASLAADRIRAAQEATFKFMNAMAGDLDGFEEVSRALFAADRPRFDALIATWPNDIREHPQRLAELAFQSPTDAESQHA